MFVIIMNINFKLALVKILGGHTFISALITPGVGVLDPTVRMFFVHVGCPDLL